MGKFPEKARDHIGWLLLTSLKHNLDKALQEAVQLHELHTKEEALEACLRQLEDELFCDTAHDTLEVEVSLKKMPGECKPSLSCTRK